MAKKNLLGLAALILSLPAVALAQSDRGLELAPEEDRTQALERLIGLFREHCFGQPSAGAAQALIETSQDLHPARDYEGVWEVEFNGISFAVAPDESNCTADVLLEYDPGRLLLTFDEVDAAIRATFEYELAMRETILRLGNDESDVRVVEATYRPLSREGGDILVEYPESNQGAFFMTLNYTYP